MTTPHRYDLASATAEEVGLDPAALATFEAAVQRRSLTLHSLLVIRHGRVVLERHNPPWTGETPHRMYSISKSFASVAIGWCVGQDLLDLDDRVIDHFPEHDRADLHPWVAAMTVRHLLTMSTAYGETTYKHGEDTDLVRTFFTATPTRPPGRLFAYDTSASVVLGALVERLSGRSLTELLTEVVWPAVRATGRLRALRTPTGLPLDHAPLGSPAWREVRDNPLGYDHAGSGVLCTPRDLARLAQFCLDRGRVDGQQIVPESYLREATSHQNDIDLRLGHDPAVVTGYGYQFWMLPHGGFACVGMGGQLALVHPEHDLIVVTTADNQLVGSLDTHVVPLVLDHLVLPLQDRPTPTAPARTTGTDRLDGTEHRFADNPFEITSLRVATGPDHGILTLVGIRGERVIEFGWDQWRSFRFPVHDLPARARGRWQGDDRLRISVRIEGEHLGSIEILLVPGDDGTLTVAMVKAAEALLGEYQGVATSLGPDS